MTSCKKNNRHKSIMCILVPIKNRTTQIFCKWDSFNAYTYSKFPLLHVDKSKTVVRGHGKCSSQNGWRQERCAIFQETIKISNFQSYIVLNSVLKKSGIKHLWPHCVEAEQKTQCREFIGVHQEALPSLICLDHFYTSNNFVPHYRGLKEKPSKSFFWQLL